MATQSRSNVLFGLPARLTVAVMALAWFAGPLQGQHLISTKAGFVNRADGRVYISRYGSVDDERGRASTGTQMRNGDQLSTEAGSFAEVLLNPGTCLRLDEKSTIRAVDTSLASISFELLSGSAILEVGELDKRTPIRISTPNATFYARRDGLVRFDLLGDTTRVSVRQGELRTGTLDQVLANEGEKIGRGRVAIFRGSSLPELAKVDRDAFDDFDVWSFGRARTLVEANNNVGVLMLELMRPYDAVKYFDAVLSRAVEHSDANISKAMALLSLGEYEDGLPLFEWRTKKLKRIREFVSIPSWRGVGTLLGRTLLIHAEQGFGDTLQFCRYGRVASLHGARVIMQVPGVLV
ncbi:MAG: hypothetical protein EBZ36_08505, partial [Acidobacteria bacterium]|nr:hypothetical protein [Acidobacteriota bacterium]